MSSFIGERERDRETERQRDRQRDRETERQRQIDRETGISESSQRYLKGILETEFLQDIEFPTPASGWAVKTCILSWDGLAPTHTH
jgi:hypothetical protein